MVLRYAYLVLAVVIGLREAYRLFTDYYTLYASKIGIIGLAIVPYVFGSVVFKYFQSMFDVTVYDEE